MINIILIFAMLTVVIGNVTVCLSIIRHWVNLLLGCRLYFVGPVHYSHPPLPLILLTQLVKHVLTLYPLALWSVVLLACTYHEHQLKLVFPKYPIYVILVLTVYTSWCLALMPTGGMVRVLSPSLVFALAINSYG